MRFWVPLVPDLKLLSSNVLAPVTVRIFTSVFKWSVHKAGDRSGNFLLEVLDVTGVWMVNVSMFWSVFVIKSSIFNRQIVLLRFLKVIKNKMNLGGKVVAVFFPEEFLWFLLLLQLCDRGRSTECRQPCLIGSCHRNRLSRHINDTFLLKTSIQSDVS